MTDTEDQTPRMIALGNRGLRVVEDCIYVLVAVLLSVGALIILVTAAIELVGSIGEGVKTAMLEVLDSLLLVFIFVELLFAVRATLAKREIVAEPFLLVGILAAIKEIVVLSVSAAEEYVSKGPEFARAMVEVGILGALVVALAGATLLLRKKEEEPEEGTGTQQATG